MPTNRTVPGPMKSYYWVVRVIRPSFGNISLMIVDHAADWRTRDVRQCAGIKPRGHRAQEGSSLNGWSVDEVSLGRGASVGLGSRSDLRCFLLVTMYMALYTARYNNDLQMSVDGRALQYYAGDLWCTVSC